MKSQGIKTLSVNSSRAYHSYLSENNRGIQIINVTSIDQKKGKFKLILDRKIHNLEAIEFKIAGNQIDSNKIKVIVYDKDINALLIKPAPDLQKQFNELTISKSTECFKRRATKFLPFFHKWRSPAPDSIDNMNHLVHSCD